MQSSQSYNKQFPNVATRVHLFKQVFAADSSSVHVLQENLGIKSEQDTQLDSAPTSHEGKKIQHNLPKLSLKISKNQLVDVTTADNTTIKGEDWWGKEGILQVRHLRKNP